MATGLEFEVVGDTPAPAEPAPEPTLTITSPLEPVDEDPVFR